MNTVTETETVTASSTSVCTADENANIYVRFTPVLIANGKVTYVDRLDKELQRFALGKLGVWYREHTAENLPAFDDSFCWLVTDGFHIECNYNLDDPFITITLTIKKEYMEEPIDWENLSFNISIFFIDLDDDGNYPITIGGKEYLVSGVDAVYVNKDGETIDVKFHY